MSVGLRPLLMRTEVHLLALASAALPGCADSTGAPREVAVRDSAGVTLVDHGRVDPDALPRWRLSAEPALRIGTVDGAREYQLFRVQHATRVGDGSVAVIDASSTLRLFGPDGTHLWTAGGEGDGPGEFRRPVMVREVPGDSLIVWDVVGSRLSVFTLEGEFVRDFTLTLPAAGTRVARGMSGPRTLLVQGHRSERTTIGGHQASVTSSGFYLVDLDGSVVGETGERRFATEFQEIRDGGPFSPAIFGGVAVVAGSPGGLWYGDTGEYELREERPGRVRRIVRWEGPDRTVTDADVAALLETWREETDEPALRRYLREYGRTHPRADRFPAYEALLVDRGGRLWVRDFVKEHRDDGLRRWTVLSPDGTAVLGRLVHPSALEPYDIGEDWLLAVEEDELGVQSLALYGLVPEGS